MNPNGQCRLGDCYYNGEGVDQDFEMAFKWYSESAAQGNAAAQSRLSVCYYSGEGVTREHQMANEWVSKSEARLCNPPAPAFWVLLAFHLAAARWREDNPIELSCVMRETDVTISRSKIAGLYAPASAAFVCIPSEVSVSFACRD